MFRASFHGIRAALKLLEFVDARRYMHLYSKLLGRAGLKFTGEPRYIASDVKFDNPSLITIGENSVVSARVIFLTHDYSLTTALRAIGNPPDTDLAANAGIRIEDNVFIGMGAILLPGTLVKKDSIVGAGAVVRGTVEAGSIMVGNPALRIEGIYDTADKWRRKAMRDGVTRDRK